MKRTKEEKVINSRGITLIAIVITVIITLILVATTISITINSGIFIQAEIAGEKWENADKNIATNETEEMIYDYANGIKYVPILEMYDSTGEIEGKLHIGDFVNYTAGSWTADEIADIQVGLKTNLGSANNSLSLPTGDYQFGGFTVGSSRDGTTQIALFSGLGTVEYIRNAETNEPISGWRVFDIDETTGKVTLISAGNPEAYYINSETNGGLVTEYILSGNVNSAWSEEEAENYQARDWSDYVNTNMKAESAYILSKAQLEAWYNKHVGTVTDLWTQSQFQQIYSKPRLHNIIDNYSFWCLTTPKYNKGTYPGPHFVQGDSGRRLRGGNGATMGIRVMVVLSEDITVSNINVGTIELTSEAHMTEAYGGNQTYNMWKIK